MHSQFLHGAAHVRGALIIDLAAATISTSSLRAGTHSITAVYLGDSIYPKAVSNAIEVKIVKLKPAVKLTASANPAATDSAVTFRATVAGNKATPTGTVTFYANDAEVGRKVLSHDVASFSIKFSRVGEHPVEAMYSGNSRFAGEASNIIEESITK